MIKDKSIFIKNIYYMLSYAFTTLTPTKDDEIAAEEFDNIHNLFAAILAKGIGQQLKQGLYREYLNCKEDIPVMCGKIDKPGTIKNKLARKQVLTCEYDELSENNLLKAYTFVPSSHIGMMNFPSDGDTFPLTLKLSSMISFCVIGNELLNIFLM